MLKRIVPIFPSSEGAQMNKASSILLLMIAAAGCAGTGSKPGAYTGQPVHWHAWIEQGGVRHPLPGTATLKKAPFEIHVVGDDEKFAYGYAATVDKNELPPLNQMPLLFRVSNGLLVDEPNTKIAVSAASVVRKQKSSRNMWAYHAPGEARLISGFQKKVKDKDGRVEYIRQIDTLCVDDGMKDTCTPIARSRIAAIYGMMAGVRVSQRTTFFEQAYVHFEFSN